MKILLNRFIENSKIDISKDIMWNKNQPITVQDIQNAITNGTIETSEPFGDTWRLWPKGERDNQYHISRIIYFVNHPEEIRDIMVEDKIWRDKYVCYVYPNATIEDGWHRLLAALYLGLKEIEVIYDGRLDVLKYLTGESDEQPYEIL